MLNDTANNSSHMMNKIFYVCRVLLFALRRSLYFDSHNHSLQFGYTCRMGL